MKSFKEIRGTLKESESGTKLPDPPPMILLRRIAIRVFPNGQRVALYQNRRLNLDVSVPYFPGRLGNPSPTKEISLAQVKESVERLDETIIKKLEKIQKNSQPDNVVFSNGASVQVQPATAKKILDLYKKVNFDNRAKLTQFVSMTPKEFKKVVDFTAENPI